MITRNLKIMHVAHTVFLLDNSSLEGKAKRDLTGFRWQGRVEGSLGQGQR